MKLNSAYVLVLLLWCAMASAQHEQEANGSDRVALTLASAESSKVILDNQNFNPNGIKLQSNNIASELQLQFRQAVADVTIEVIDVKGRLLKDFRGRNVSTIYFDTAKLVAGDYFIRVKSNMVEDFLKFRKE